MTLEKTAAKIAVILFACVALIQVAIAAGLAPVTIVWGGGQTELTVGLRLASIAAAIILLGFARIVHVRANYPAIGKHMRILTWMVAAYMVLNTLGNATSPSWFERYVFGATTLVLAICTGIVASSPLGQTDEYESLDNGDTNAGAS